jgi:hypothetical protein
MKKGISSLQKKDYPRNWTIGLKNSCPWVLKMNSSNLLPKQFPITHEHLQAAYWFPWWLHEISTEFLVGGRWEEEESALGFLGYFDMP